VEAKTSNKRQVSWAEETEDEENEGFVGDWRVAGKPRAAATPKSRARASSAHAPHEPPHRPREPNAPVLLRFGPFEGDLDRKDRHTGVCQILSKVLGREFAHSPQHRIWTPKRFGNFVLIACPDQASARTLKQEVSNGDRLELVNSDSEEMYLSWELHGADRTRAFLLRHLRSAILDLERDGRCTGK